MGSVFKLRNCCFPSTKQCWHVCWLYRCFYLAQFFSAAGKHAEAYLLFHRAQEYANVALSKQEASKYEEEVTILIFCLRHSIHYNCILEAWMHGLFLIIMPVMCFLIQSYRRIWPWCVDWFSSMYVNVFKYICRLVGIRHICGHHETSHLHKRKVALCAMSWNMGQVRAHKVYSSLLSSHLLWVSEWKTVFSFYWKQVFLKVQNKIVQSLL